MREHFCVWAFIAYPLTEVHAFAFYMININLIQLLYFVKKFILLIILFNIFILLSCTFYGPLIYCK